MKLVALVLIAITIPLMSHQSILQNPVSASFTYESGVDITLARGVDSLEKLTISSGEMKATIPAGEMTDIFHPHLYEVEFTEYLEPETRKPQMEVTLKYDLRPYEWGLDSSEVTFIFIDGKYSYRRTAVPIRKDRQKVSEKKRGEAEQGGGMSGSQKGVSEDK